MDELLNKRYMKEIDNSIREKALHYAKEDRMIEFLSLFFNVFNGANPDVEVVEVEIGEKNIFSSFLVDGANWKEVLTRLSGEHKEFVRWFENIALFANGIETVPSTCVVRFDKRKYDADELSVMSDIQKYITAIKDKDCAEVYTIEEFENILNRHLPMDRYYNTYVLFGRKMYSNEYKEEV